MNRQFYYLVAGLPDIFFDDKKLVISTAEYLTYLSEHLEKDELELIKLFFWQYDNINILNRLKNKEATHQSSANLSTEMLDELLFAAKDDSFESMSFNVPEYIPQFITSYKSDTPVFPGKSWDLQITEMYYKHLVCSPNKYIANWFLFEQNLGNILTAYNCRKAELSAENQLIGSGELYDKLIKSSARDFGLDDDDLPMAESVFKALETADLMDQEKKIDTIRWELLDETSFFHYFSIEKLFVFLIKLSIVERWMSLDKTKGLELFKELLNSLESSYEFPAEFSLK
jgi:hypothetical protein